MRFIAFILTLALTGCVNDSVVYNPTTHAYDAHRTAVLTNIGTLKASVSTKGGDITASIDESGVDQTTGVANAMAAMAAALANPTVAP